MQEGGVVGLIARAPRAFIPTPAKQMLMTNAFAFGIAPPPLHAQLPLCAFCEFEKRPGPKDWSPRGRKGIPGGPR
jgi:hypothetical protein